MIRIEFQVYPNDNARSVHVIRRLYIDRIKQIDEHTYRYGVWIDRNPDDKVVRKKLPKGKTRPKPDARVKHKVANGDLVLMHKVFLKLRKLIWLKKI